MPTLRWIVAAFLLGLSLAATPGADPDKPKEGVSPALKPYAGKLLEIAKSYETFGRVDDEMRWAPIMCRMPRPGSARFSTSKDDDTHGRKLYSIFAKQRDAYLKVSHHAKDRVESPVGQIIVKESWTPEELKAGEKVDGPRVKGLKLDGATKFPDFANLDHFNPYATREGKTYKAAKPAGLFLMMKFDKKTPDTDDGWVYGTVSANRKTVTAVGKIASCMECHQKTKHDRLFGMYPDDKPYKKP